RDDECWKNSKPAPFVLAYERDHSQPKYPTTVQAVWSDQGVTFGFRMIEPRPQTLQKSRTGRDNSMLWWDDNVELLLDVTGKDQGEYYHFIISANGTIADSREKDIYWDCQAIQTAAQVGKDFWSLEVFLPF